MLVKITQIKDNKMTVEKEGKKKVYTLEEFVIPHAKLGVADITFNEESKTISFISMQSDVPAPEDKSVKGLAKVKNIVKISGKDFMTYEGLLSKAHKKDPNFSMKITESWVSEDMKRAWCKVRLTVANEGSAEKIQIFDGFGSSTPENTGQMTQSHPVEMANTRAKGRALRDYLNIGMVMAEELKQDK